MGKTLVLIHGRDTKPPEEELRDLLFTALAHGIERDRPDKLGALRAARKQLAYYGDLSNAFLALRSGAPPPDDLASRRATLATLRSYAAEDFDAETYAKLPGVSSWKRNLLRWVAEPLAFLRLGGPLIARAFPDVGQYWNFDSEFGSEVRWVATRLLAGALWRGDEVLLISHSLGSLIAYDTLWKLSHYGEYASIRRRRVSLWITTGSPLGDTTYRRQLKGARAGRHRRHPTNVRRWLNVAARDDFVAYECSMARSYADMRADGWVESIEDREIYNLAVRDGRSNPHHMAGYLIHPVLAQAVADWL